MPQTGLSLAALPLHQHPENNACSPRLSAAQADANLRFHFSGRSLRQWLPHLGRTAHEVLREEYATGRPGEAPQPGHGLVGQAHACWAHHLSGERACLFAFEESLLALRLNDCHHRVG